MSITSLQTKSLGRFVCLPVLIAVASCSDDGGAPTLQSADAAADAAADASKPTSPSDDGGDKPNSPRHDAGDEPGVSDAAADRVDGSVTGSSGPTSAASTSGPNASDATLSGATTSSELSSAATDDSSATTDLAGTSETTSPIDSVSTDVATSGIAASDTSSPGATSEAPSSESAPATSELTTTDSESTADTSAPPACEPSGSCSTNNGFDCEGDAQVARDCSGCALLARCGGVACCDLIANYGAVTYPDFELQPSLVTDFTQSSSAVSVSATFTGDNQAAAVIFKLSQSVSIDPSMLELDVDLVGVSALSVSLEDGTGAAGCMYQVQTNAGVTTVDPNEAPTCWGSFDEESPVGQINVRIDSNGSGAAQLTVNSITWEEAPGPYETCSDSCAWSNDGYCDDGGEGAVGYYCAYGTDCSDCGERTEPMNEACNNACAYFANDGYCDDGGSSSVSSYCDYGSDCNDCGSRE